MLGRFLARVATRGDARIGTRQPMIFVLGYDPGSVHRWAALIKFDGANTPALVAVYQVPESREGGWWPDPARLPEVAGLEKVP